MMALLRLVRHLAHAWFLGGVRLGKVSATRLFDLLGDCFHTVGGDRVMLDTLEQWHCF